MRNVPTAVYAVAWLLYDNVPSRSCIHDQDCRAALSSEWRGAYRPADVVGSGNISVSITHNNRTRGSDSDFRVRKTQALSSSTPIEDTAVVTGSPRRTRCITGTKVVARN